MPPRPRLGCLVRLAGEDGNVPLDPFRSTYAGDVFLYHDASEPGRHLDALLCGFHDLRAVAQTMADAQRKGSVAAMSFLLNDVRPEIVARSLLIMYALCFEPDVKLAFAAQLWFSARLEPAAHEFWIKQMHECLDRDWIDLASPIRVMDEATLLAVRRCWRAWIQHASQPSPAENATATTTASVDAHARDHCTAAVFWGYERLLSPAAEGRLRTAIDRHLDEQTFFLGLDDKLDCSPTDCPTNVTFLGIRPDGTTMPLADTLPSPLTGICFPVDAGVNLERLMLDQARDWLTALNVAFNPDRPPGEPRYTLTFVADDAVLLLERLVADPARRIDVIDTSSLLDTCGLLNLVVHGAVTLKPNSRTASDRSMLRAFSRKLSESQLPVTLLAESLLIAPHHTCPYLFGVALLEVLGPDEWQSSVRLLAHHDRELAAPRYLSLTFAKTEVPGVPMTLDEYANLDVH
ncbi:hypothetical protein H9P43_007159 [Blastocladiella emersonii ATCC 22665]|nr:hypothetical protein H9P43_007159 [Blastocladiella emersonii ATCC 22665]